MACPNDCDCCTGTAVTTPVERISRPGLPALAYRVGTFSAFRETMLARLSSVDFPALAPLTTRDESDFTVALCGAFAVVADILTFYQERIANESYLRTATQRRSVLELAALIGYRLGPGVSAATALAFQLDPAPGAPELSARPVTIPTGTRVQSVADPNQTAQTFQTDADIVANVEWNAIQVQQSEPVPIAAGVTTEIFVAGAHNRFDPGDALLLVDEQRVKDTASVRWQVVRPEVVEPDRDRDLTRLGWTDPLGIQWVEFGASGRGIRAYCFRQRATLFGSQAPDPKLLKRKDAADPINDNFDGNEWKDFGIPANSADVDLDNLYPRVVKKGWFVLSDGDQENLYRALSVSHRSRSNFGISAKIARLRADTQHGLSHFKPRTAIVLAESEELTLVERPLTFPLYGDRLVLDVLATDLQPLQLLGVSGKRQRVSVGVTTDGVLFDGQPDRVAKPGESFIMLAPPVDDASGASLAAPLLVSGVLPATTTIRWTVEDHKGGTLVIKAAAGLMALARPRVRDKPVSELVAILDAPGAVTSDDERTTVQLKEALTNCYDRTTATVNANVAPATHGETTKEIVGSGDARQRNQRFRVKQAPLTYVPSADNPTGRASTLELRVNDLLWTEAPSLYGAGPLDRIYELRQDDDGNTTIQFGDGRVGARVPTGNSNVRATYRRGLGAAGNLRVGQISTLLSRPLGVRSVNNPGPSVGGQDPETLDGARRNAPLQVLTIDRVVSPDDYAAFSRTFAGVAKAHALWIPAHPRGMYVTVAGVAGANLPDGGENMNALIGALRKYGDPLLPLTVRNCHAVGFRVNAAIEVAPDANAKAVRAAVVRVLQATFGFDARDLGQPVTVDEVYATIQAVPGVRAVDITELYRQDPGAEAALIPRLAAALPTVQPDGTVSVAELLTLSADPLALGVMT